MADAPRSSRGLTALFGAWVAVLITWWARSADPDLFARVAVGRLVLRDWNVPIVDPFAFTPKLSLWIDHEWLSGVVFYLLTDTFGDAGIFVFRIAIMSLTVWLISAAMHARGRCLPFCLVIGIALCAYVWSSPIRAQVFTYAALAALGWIMTQVRRTQRLPKLYVVIPIFAAWTNLHGGVVAGLGLYLTFCLCQSYSHSEQRWCWLLQSLAVVLASALSPYGAVQYWGYLFNAVTMDRPTIAEWAVLDFSNGAAVLWLGWVLVLALGMLKERAQLQLSELAVITLSIVAGVRADRLTAIAIIMGLSYGSIYLAAGCESSLAIFSRLGAAIKRAGLTAIFMLCAAASFVAARDALQGDPIKLKLDGYPVAALDWLHSNRAGGKLLNNFNVGSFALWRLYPNFLISLDGRYETVYPNSTVEAVSCALDPGCSEWQARLDEISPDFILIEREQLERWNQVEKFELIFSDQKFAVLGSRSDLPAVRREIRTLWQADF